MPNNTTEIKSCTCKHDYQDEKYGPGNRVFNVIYQKDPKLSPKKYCTVCSRKE